MVRRPQKGATPYAPPLDSLPFGLTANLLLVIRQMLCVSGLRPASSLINPTRPTRRRTSAAESLARSYGVLVARMAGPDPAF